MACALVSSLLYALASVLQQRAAFAQPSHTNMRWGLMARLLRSRTWMIGIGLDAFAYALQFVALGHGSLVLVQPLLVCGLLFALPLGAWVAGSRMSVRDWWGAIALVAGLSLFLVTASPGAGHANASARSWITLFLVTGIADVALVLIALGPERRNVRYRSTLLATAAAVTYGVTAALTKTAAHLLNLGVSHLLVSWVPYVLIAGGALGMLMAQSAFQAGALDASLPTLTVVDPVASVVIGAALLGETVRSGAVPTPLELLGLVLVTVGVIALSKAEAAHLAPEETAEAP